MGGDVDRASRPGKRTAALGTLVALAVAQATTAAAGAVWTGMPVHDVVASYLATNLAIAVVFTACGAVVAWHRPDNPVGWLLLFVGLAHGTTAAVTPLLVAGGQRGWSATVMAGLATAYAYGWPWAIGIALPVALLLFPDGRPPSRSWRRVVWVVVAVGGAFVVMMGSEPANVVLGDGTVVDHPLTMVDHERLGALWETVGLAVLGSYLAAFVGLIARYRRGDETQRRQLLWLLLGVGAAVIVPLPTTQLGTGPILLILAICLIPASISIAVVRHNLLDIRLVVSRVVLWLLLSLCVVTAYVALVALLGQLLNQRFSTVVAALAVALAFNPARLAAQRLVDRVVYRDAHDPVRAVARVDDHLGLSHDLSGLLDALRDALRVPYAELRTDGANLTAGSPPPHLHSRRLVFADTHVGDLVVGLRPGERSLRARDGHVLDLLAAPLAVAVRATALSGELQRSQERLIEAREDERRRLQRDLHDGLGPTLTGVTFKADAARNLLRHEPDRADVLLDELQADVRAAIADVRRLIHALRPAVLDDLGLVGALRQHVDHLGNGGRPDGLDVRLDAPPSLPGLPAAVEVAVYRVAIEALTNVVRHARARQAVVLLRLDRDLHLEVADDGPTCAGEWRAGVGLTAMRERVSELGGSLSAGPGPGGGRVRASFPLRRS